MVPPGKLEYYYSYRMQADSPEVTVVSAHAMTQNSANNLLSVSPGGGGGGGGEDEDGDDDDDDGRRVCVG
jgi:hypothetical protein